MIVKVVLGTMQSARKLVSIAEGIPYDVELCYGRYAVNAKSMLGVLSMPEFDKGELHIHTDVKDIEKVYAMINQAGLNSTQDTVHFLPFWENGVKFFTIEGPNKEKVEFSQYL